MAAGFLFSWEIECDLAADFRCKSCGATGQAIYLRKPILRQSGAEVRVFYPARCGACNKVSGFGRRMPILQFGFILARCKLHARGRQSADSAEKCVRPGKPETLTRICSEFEEILAQHAGSIPGPISDTDRLQFGMSPEDWSRFLKRLGADEGGRKRGG